MEAVCRHAQDRPHAPAASDRRRCMDYAGLREEVGLAAGALTRRGIGRGERIALHLPNGLDFLVLVLAAGWAGWPCFARRAWAEPAGPPEVPHPRRSRGTADTPPAR